MDSKKILLSHIKIKYWGLSPAMEDFTIYIRIRDAESGILHKVIQCDLRFCFKLSNIAHMHKSKAKNKEVCCLIHR